MVLQAATAALREISELFAGDSIAFTESVPGYPASSGYTLKYRLAPLAGGAGITLTAVASGDDYAIAVAPATTAAWVAGEYSWTAWTEKAGERRILGQGRLTIKADPTAANTGTDTRSGARKILAAVEALLEGFTDVAEYVVGDVSIKRMSREQLLAARQTLKAEVAAEERAERIANGEAVPNRLRVRF